MTIIESGQRAARVPWTSLVAAAALAFPIELPAVGDYTPTLSFLLAPLIAWAVIASLKDSIGRVFVVADLCGLASILISAWIKPDGRLHLDLLSLVLLMFTAGFYFLGRHLDRRFVVYFVVFSALFLVPATLRNILQHETVHAASADNYNVLNVEWFGWKMFGNFGILGAAHMICLQAALALGVVLSAKRLWIMVAGSAVIVCAEFLIVGSESRGAVLSLLIILIGTTYYTKAYKGARRYVGPVLIIGLVVAGVSQFESSEGNRLFKTAHDVAAIIVHDAEVKPAFLPTASAVPLAAPVPVPTLDAISSNRFSLQEAAFNEFLSSPILGSGFSPLGRYAPLPDGVQQVTPHLFYLTVLWKGGLLFSIPFFAFFVMSVLAAWRSRSWRHGPMEFAAVMAVAVLFSLMALTAETPNVPSAGALGFLLLGLLNPPPRTDHGRDV